MLFRVSFERVPGCFVAIARFPGFFVGLIKTTGRMAPYSSGCLDVERFGEFATLRERFPQRAWLRGLHLTRRWLCWNCVAGLRTTLEGVG